MLLIAIGALIAPSPASAATGLNGELSGPFSGTTVFDFSTPRCTFVHQTYDATYTTKNGARGTLHLDGCIDFVPTTFSYDGTFRLRSTRDGSTLRGHVTGTVTNSTTQTCAQGAFPSDLDFTLTASRGTLRYAHVTGSIRLTGLWCSFANMLPPRFDGPISGSLAAHVARAHGLP
jgi:hypothetical protein